MQQRTKRLFAVILFLDIVDFTKFSESNDPEVVDDYLSFFFEFCSKQIKKNNGWIEKYIGDAICAIFYSSSSTSKDTINACNCAFNILNGLHDFKLSGRFPFSIRIGIDSGLVTTTKRDQYDVFVGQAINSASRIQSIAKHNSCYVSERIAKNADYFFNFNEVGDFELKGISEKIKIFQLIEKKNIFKIEKMFNSFFPRKEEIEIVKILTKSKKFRLVIKGPQGCGKTSLIWKANEYLQKLYNIESIYLSLNDWENSIDDLIQKVNLSIDFKDDNDNEDNKNKILIIDNFHTINSKLEAIKFLISTQFGNSLIISYTIEKEIDEQLNSLLKSLEFEIISVEKLTFEEFSLFLNSYFEKQIPATFEINLYNLCDGLIGRTSNLLELLKNEFSLTSDQIVQIDFNDIFSQREDLLEHCYRINGIDQQMQILLSIFAFSLKPLNLDELLNISKILDISNYQDFISKAYKKGWLNYDNSYYTISNNYLKQFIINSSSRQLKKNIIKTLLDISTNSIDKLNYLLSLDDENNSTDSFINIDEEDLFKNLFIELESEKIEVKLLLIRNLIKKIEKNFFYNITKFLLLDTNLFPYLLNILKKEELQIIFKLYSDLDHIKQLNSINLIFNKKEFFNINSLDTNSNSFNNNENNIKISEIDDFYTILLKYLIVPGKFSINFNEYQKFHEIISSSCNFDSNYLYLFHFMNNINDFDHQANKVASLFDQENNIYSHFEKIYLNPEHIFTSKLQLFFLLIENISSLLYYKKKPIHIIIKLLQLCEKIALELDFPILKEYYYGLFFYSQFILSNFHYYGIHQKMEFTILPELKKINEIIYHLFSFSLEHKEDLSKENKFLNESLSNAKTLFLNPPYYIPICIGFWYYFLLTNDFDDEIILYKNRIKLLLDNNIEKLKMIEDKNHQTKNLIKTILSFA